MIYSNLYKKWIATCMKCDLALINFEAMSIQYYDYEILTGYFIIYAEMLKVWKMY